MKKIKITKEQHDNLIKAGLIKESINQVDKDFNTAFAGKKINSVKYMPEEKIVMGPKFKLKEVVDNLLEYIYGLNENLNPFFESHGINYEQLCETLEEKGYLVKKEGNYKVSKKHGDINSIKESISEAILEFANQITEDNLPLGSQNDPNAPWNRQELKQVRGEKSNEKFVDLKYYNSEIAIFRDLQTNQLYVYYYDNIDVNLLKPYADKYGYLDADGDMEYNQDFEVDGEVLENYVNDNFRNIPKGKGVNDFESPESKLVLIDDELKSDLLRLHDKDSKLVMVLEPIAEATGASSSGAYVGLFSPTNKSSQEYDGKKLPPVVSETDMTSVGNIGYDNPGFVGISRDGKFPTNPKKTNAQKKTQWAGGSFVEMDNCTKLNNNKAAQNGKCSTGAIDNVVKLKKTSGNVNAPSLKETFMREALKLQHDKEQSRFLVISDLEGRDGSKETFTNKAILKQNGFNWNGTHWVIPVDKLDIAKKTLSLVNKVEYIVDSIEQLEVAVEESSADNKSLLKSRLDQYITDLANATDEAALSAEIRRYLTFFSKFHNYSFYNRMLIFIQKPDATRVSSYKTWQSKFRQVNKGAKAITVLAPIITKSNDDENDSEITSTNDVRGYKAVKVFDISDTSPIDERGDVPDTPQWWGENTPSETADRLYDIVVEVASDLGIKVTQSDANAGEKGYSRGDHINISSDVSGAGRLSTMIHEIAHELMHWKKSSIYYIDNGSNSDSRALAELQAESVSYVVLKHYGIPVSHHSTYLALWKANKEKIQNNLEIISKVSEFIITKIDNQIT